MLYLWVNRTLSKKLYSRYSQKGKVKYVSTIRSTSRNRYGNRSKDTGESSDICIIFGGEDASFAEESNLLEFNQAFVDIEPVDTGWLTA